MTELKEQLLEILKEKEQKIVAENIKAGVTIFDIAGIYEGEKGLDTSDATAIARDLAKGKTAYVNGKKITGEAIEYATDGNLMSYSQWGDGMKYPTDDPTNRYMTFYMKFYNYDKILRWNYNHGMAISYTSLKNALGLTADKIAAGEKILDLIGTYKGLDTSDATATAGDILKDKTAYVNGEKVTGTMEAGASDNNVLFNNNLPDGILNQSNIITSIVKINDDLVFSGTTAQYKFDGCSSLEYIKSIDTSNVTNMQYMFRNCSKLKTIPVLDTSKVTTMIRMFQDCTSLITIPVLDTSKVTHPYNMFLNCSNLSDESLNNILAMCINAIAYIALGANLTLKYIGLTSEQVTRCQSLSNYEAFIAAGWVTGY